MLVILCLLLLAIPTESYPKSRPLIKKIAKPVAKSTLPILSTTALYLGLDSLVRYISEEPELSAIFVSIFGTTLIIAILLIVKFILKIYRAFHPTTSPIPPTELTQFQNTLDEIVQRTVPPIRN
ncbi:unnamed protein product [Meloidogyne enterolobii]|uniref:Uncharacterized protein n=2 Tax=Meloidogyne enterolobii TaxID=390850 RepID=A0ACB0Z210_MELEN